MDRGTYVAASGGLLQLRRLEIVNNNLANAQTPGFKGQYLVTRTREFGETLAGQIVENDPYARGDHDRAPDARSIRTVTDFTAGPIEGTSNPLDVALRDPNEFFVVNTAEGLRYTRAGNFTLNAEGNLVTNSGQPVQGDGGALTVTEGAARIAPNGGVFSGDEQIGRLQVVRFENPQDLERIGSNLFKINLGQAGPTEVDEPQVIEQSLEMSNISTIESMLHLISANRGFEMYTKTAKTIDEMNQAAITQVGRSR